MFNKIFKVAMMTVITLSVINAQGTVTGNVVGEDGNPITGANVILAGTSLGAASGTDGVYTIIDVPSGDFVLVVSAIGFQRGEKAVTVKDGERVEVSFQLGTDILEMSSVVVTGTPGGTGMQKKDASYAVNTLDEIEMRQLAPASTASMLESVPGVWAESSGGVAGANIFVRGLPSSGDAPFVTMALNGGPIYGTEMLSFFEQSSIFRIDETVQTTEASRGGPNAVFSNGEPGLTVNFNLRRGSDVSKGRVKYETSDYNLQRFDAFMSGKVTDGLYYMLGGYVKTSPGIRNTQFNSENGQQFTAQLTKVFKNGVVNAYTRLTDDYGQWVLPMSLGNGLEKGTFAQLGNATRFRELAVNTQGDKETFDFADGRGWKGSVSGMNASFDLGSGWMVRDNMTYTNGNANTLGFVPSGSAIKVSALGRDTVRTASGMVLSSDDYVQNYGHWVVLKDMESINNDLSLNKQMGGHDITVGMYQARWSSIDFWTLGNFIAVHNVANGEQLESGITADTVAAYGGGGAWNYGLDYAGDSRVTAYYGADSWQLGEKLRIDLGIRYESYSIDFALDHGALPDGVTDVAKSLTGSDMAYTGAVNFELNPIMGVFARYSNSFQFPHFDMIRENLYAVNSDGDLESNRFSQSEFGLKYNTPMISMFATAFLNNADVFDGDVGSARESALLNTQTYGVELDGAVALGNLMLRAVATYQKGEIKTCDADPTVVGNSIWRQPDMQLRLSPSYAMAIGGMDMNIYSAIRLVGDRWDSRANTFQLEGYTKIDAGVNIKTASNLSYRIHLDNLTNSEGLTEGDPRDPASANGRPIFGRSMNFSVAYDF